MLVPAVSSRSASSPSRLALAASKQISRSGAGAASVGSTRSAAIAAAQSGSAIAQGSAVAGADNAVACAARVTGPPGERRDAARRRGHRRPPRTGRAGAPCGSAHAAAPRRSPLLASGYLDVLLQLVGLGITGVLGAGRHPLDLRVGLPGGGQQLVDVLGVVLHVVEDEAE